MQYKRICALALALTLLCGCQNAPEETTVPTTLPPVTEPAPTQPPTQPPTEPPTEPEVILEEGLPVTLDGKDFASVLSEGVTYVKAAEFLGALDGAQPQGDEEMGYTLTWEGREYTFDPVQEGLLLDGEPYPTYAPLLNYQGAVYLPLEEICGLMNISFLNDEERGHLYCTSGILGWEVPEGINVPVLMYHAVGDDLWGIRELFVSPADMEAQLAYLVENGYDTITFEDLAHLEDYDKPVMLTFDDGYMDNYTALYPLLQKYNCKATVFVITANLGVSKHSMYWENAREMFDSGLVSIQSHTYSHAMMDAVDEAEMEKQMWQSKLAIARYTGREPFVLCFPSGRYNEDTLAMVPRFYRFGIAMDGGMYTTGEDVRQVDRYYVSRDTTLSEFAAMIEGAGT